MTNSMSFIGFSTALLLPWFLGTIWLRLVYRRSNDWNWPFLLGYGYLLGIFFVTATLRVWNSLGYKLDFWPIASLLIFIGISGAFLSFKVKSLSQPEKAVTADFENAFLWQKSLIVFLLIIIFIRYGTIFLESAWRPLYSWDAWMNWAPKARIWFEFNRLTPFVSPDNWLTQGTEHDAFTLGNWAVWRYPITVPLVQLWTAKGAGHWSDSLINIPWVLCSLALALAFFGQARLAGIPLTPSFIAMFLLLTIPYISIHTALGGYADLWLTAYFSLAAFSFFNWASTKNYIQGFLTLMFALICTQIKIPGIALAICLVPAVLLGVFPPRIRNISFFLLLVATIVVLTIGISIELPDIGSFKLTFKEISIPYVGRFGLEYHSVWNAVTKNLIYFDNWHLLWHSIVFMLPILMVNPRYWSKRLPHLTLLLYCIAFIFIVFFFTRHYISVMDYTTLNRALLYIVPATIYFFTQLLTSPISRRQYHGKQVQ